MIRVILPAIVLFVLLLGGGGLYVLYENLQGKQTTLSTNGSNENVSSGGIALRMMFENATGQVTKTPDIDLRGHIPPAPDGWYAKYYEQKDGETIVGAELIPTMVSKSTTNDILLAFRRSDQAGAGGETQTYMRGSLLMALRMQRLEQINTNTVQGQIMGEINATMAAFDSGFGTKDATPGLFARADGIDWIEKPRTSRRTATSEITPVNYRRFTAKIGGYIQLEIITNAADAHVAALIEQIDMAALNGLLPSPAPEYRAGVGVFTAKENLSEEPPGKSMAMIAYETLNDGRIYPALEARILQRMVEGDITDWDSLIKRNGAAFVPSETLLGILGPEPDHVKLQRTAHRLMHGNTPVIGSERTLVERIASGRILSQADARASHLYDGVTASDGTKALIALLPLGSDNPQAAEANTSASADEPAERPSVRRGASGGNLGADDCAIELGVRRCVLTDD